ncbi:MAG TPA: hypothetical protein VJH94_01035 [Candidatus Paceibacterota bacterium]
MTEFLLNLKVVGIFLSFALASAIGAKVGHFVGLKLEDAFLRLQARVEGWFYG